MISDAASVRIAAALAARPPIEAVVFAANAAALRERIAQQHRQSGGAL
jgi:hypothetical protein